jgi:hypothetical protein
MAADHFDSLRLRLNIDLPHGFLYAGDIRTLRRQEGHKETDRLGAARCDVVARDDHREPTDIDGSASDGVSGNNEHVVAQIENAAVLAEPGVNKDLGSALAKVSKHPGLEIRR